jgi:hypothetical protein
VSKSVKNVVFYYSFLRNLNLKFYTFINLSKMLASDRALSTPKGLFLGARSQTRRPVICCRSCSQTPLAQLASHPARRLAVCKSWLASLNNRLVGATSGPDAWPASRWSRPKKFTRRCWLLVVFLTRLTLSILLDAFVVWGSLIRHFRSLRWQKVLYLIPARILRWSLFLCQAMKVSFCSKKWSVVDSIFGRLNLDQVC